jgi:hypothetical protein
MGVPIKEKGKKNARAMKNDNAKQTQPDNPKKVKIQ